MNTKKILISLFVIICASALSGLNCYGNDEAVFEGDDYGWYHFGGYGQKRIYKVPKKDCSSESEAIEAIKRQIYSTCNNCGVGIEKKDNKNYYVTVLCKGHEEEPTPSTRPSTSNNSSSTSNNSSSTSNNSSSTSNNSSSTSNNSSSTSNNNGDFWGSATNWFKDVKGSYTMPSEAKSIIEVFTDMINVVGTTVIVIATIVLGIKYIIGTVDSRTQAKDGLITLFVACVFFFGWTSISNLLFPSNNFIFLSDDDTNYTNMVGRVFATFSYVGNIVAIILVIYVGVRYILAGATGKADLKGRSIYFIVGIILVFATSNVLNFVSRVITETLQ